MSIFKKINLIFLSTTLLIGLSPPGLSSDLTVPDTGQDLCYDWDNLMDECPSEGEDFYGQDGNYTINPPDLTDNMDGTVTDNLTGLTWEQKTEENEPNTYTYSDATAYCNDLTLGGYSDWSIPTRKEYSTILNFARVSPALDTDYFPFYSYTTPNEVYYWTVSECYDDPTQVWKILMSFGLIEKGPKTDLNKVRCVRGDTEPAASYTDNGDGTVTDDVTGLMWEQKTDDGGTRDKDITYTWKDALAYCENLLLGGHDNWRLPNTKELERVVDLGSSSPAIDTTYFPNTNNGLYWTGTTCSGCHKMKAFAVDFTDGELYYGNKYRNGEYYENYVRCLRTSDAAGSTTTTSPVASTTTTTVSSQGCSIGKIYGEDSDEVRLLRGFRDNILSKTPEGQEIVRLYYEWSPVIVKAIEGDKGFKEEIKAIVDEILLIIDVR
jgi:hypothetical protein